MLSCLGGIRNSGYDEACLCGCGSLLCVVQFWTGEVPLTAILILLVTLIGSLFIERPFCKYLCPYGALLGIFNKFRIFTIRRNPSTCINCKACARACPMNITGSTAGAVRDHQCITCLKCTSEAACPVQETVELMAGNVSKEVVK